MNGWLYGVHRTCAETAAVSRGTSHATTKERSQYTTAIKGHNYSFKITCDMSVVRLLESYIKAVNNNNNEFVRRALLASSYQR